MMRALDRVALLDFADVTHVDEHECVVVDSGDRFVAGDPLDFGECLCGQVHDSHQNLMATR